MILTTERLLLREFTENDWHIVFAYQSDPRYLRYAPWTHRLREKGERLVQEFIGWQHEQPRCQFQLAMCCRRPSVNRHVWHSYGDGGCPGGGTGL